MKDHYNRTHSGRTWVYRQENNEEENDGERTGGFWSNNLISSYPASLPQSIKINGTLNVEQETLASLFSEMQDPKPIKLAASILVMPQVTAWPQSRISAVKAAAGMTSQGELDDLYREVMP